MKFELEDYHGNVSDEELIADLKRVALGLKKNSVTRAEYDNYGKFHSDTLRRRFGSWPMALEKAGLDFSKSSKKVYPNRRKTNATNQELLEDLKNVAVKLNKNTVLISVYKEHGKYSISIFVHRFDSWSKALEKAGLEKTRVYGITDEELFQNFKEVWIRLGRQPHYNDIQKPLSKYSKSVYISRFSTWRKAIGHFIEYINKGETPVVVEKPSIIEVSEFPQKVSNKQKSEQVEVNAAVKKPVRIIRPKLDGHKTTRSVPGRLIFIIMKRDNFKCQQCGRSPATDPTIILHVDHKTPYSKGGETVPENLQTLCSKCNIGKSNLE